MELPVTNQLYKLLQVCTFPIFVLSKLALALSLGQVGSSVVTLVCRYVLCTTSNYRLEWIFRQLSSSCVVLHTGGGILE